MRVEANGPFDVTSVISTLARHEIDGLTVTDVAERTHRRFVNVDGEPAELTLAFDSDGVEVSDPTGVADPDSIGKLVSVWFDLDTDIEAIDSRLAPHKAFEARVKSSPGVRITGHPDPWEAAVLTVLGQQVSLGAARTFSARLVGSYGERGSELFRFPAPGRVAADPVDRLRETLGVTGARARTVHEVAALFSDESDPDLLRLAALPGVGPWTIACVSIRGRMDPDEFPASDAVLRRTLGGVSAREAESIAAQWSPYRSYATVRLWADAVPAS